MQVARRPAIPPAWMRHARGGGGGTTETAAATDGAETVAGVGDGADPGRGREGAASTATHARGPTTAETTWGALI
jgi:hypothetical protein